VPLLAWYSEFQFPSSQVAVVGWSQLSIEYYGIDGQTRAVRLRDVAIAAGVALDGFTRSSAQAPPTQPWRPC